MVTDAEIEELNDEELIGNGTPRVLREGSRIIVRPKLRTLIDGVSPKSNGGDNFLKEAFMGQGKNTLDFLKNTINYMQTEMKFFNKFKNSQDREISLGYSDTITSDSEDEMDTVDNVTQSGNSTSHISNSKTRIQEEKIGYKIRQPEKTKKLIFIKIVLVFNLLFMLLSTILMLSLDYYYIN